MRDILSDARGIWARVIQDLLTVSPNSVLKTCALDATGAQLRSLALRYNWIDQALSLPDISQLFEKRTIALSPPLLDAALIQGSSVLVHITSVGSVHMTSSVTGEQVFSWYSPEHIVVQDAYIMLYYSPTVGMVLMIRIVLLGGGRRLWMFRVTTTRPSLAPVFDSGPATSIADVSVYDDTVIAVHAEGGGISVALISLPSTFSNAPEPLSWSLLPDEVFQMLFWFDHADLLLVYRSDLLRRAAHQPSRVCLP
jgi:hypothetical protein